jgi:hypothetical protein
MFPCVDMVAAAFFSTLWAFKDDKFKHYLTPFIQPNLFAKLTWERSYRAPLIETCMTTKCCDHHTGGGQQASHPKPRSQLWRAKSGRVTIPLLPLWPTRAHGTKLRSETTQGEGTVSSIRCVDKDASKMST